jgi:hypothetical protein
MIKKQNLIDRRQFKQDYVGYLDRYRKHLYTLVPGDSIPTQLTWGDYDDSDPVELMENILLLLATVLKILMLTQILIYGL